MIINTLWLAYGDMGVLVGVGSGFGRWWVRVWWVVGQGLVGGDQGL